MQEKQVQSLSWEEPLKKEMATHSSILAWEIPWIEEPAGLKSMRSKRVRHNLATKQHQTALHLSENLAYLLFCFKTIRMLGAPSAQGWKDAEVTCLCVANISYHY